MSLSVVNNENYTTEDKDMMLFWNLEELAPHIALTLTDVLTGETINLNTQNEYNFTTYAKGSFPAYNQDASSVASYPLVNETRLILSLNYNNSLSVKDVNPLPETFTLHPPYPNPFNPRVKFDYSLPFESEVEVLVYNINGQMISELVDASMQSGKYSIEWNAGDYSSGVYFVKFNINNIASTQRVTLLK